MYAKYAFKPHPRTDSSGHNYPAGRDDISGEPPGFRLPGSVPVPVVTPVAIPATGFYIYVDYLGSFSGSFGTATNMVNVRDSGEHLYLVDPVNGTVTAGFAKLDDSSYPITVKVYESGQVLTTRTSADPFGMVNVTANP